MKIIKGLCDKVFQSVEKPFFPAVMNTVQRLDCHHLVDFGVFVDIAQFAILVYNMIVGIETARKRLEIVNTFLPQQIILAVVFHAVGVDEGKQCAAVVPSCT